MPCKHRDLENSLTSLLTDKLLLYMNFKLLRNSSFCTADLFDLYVHVKVLQKHTCAG